MSADDFANAGEGPVHFPSMSLASKGNKEEPAAEEKPAAEAAGKEDEKAEEPEPSTPADNPDIPKKTETE